MYAQRCTNTKHYLTNYYQPKPSFLSPVNKFGQRSFSSSSLPNNITPSPLNGSLREQIRLQAFKKNLTESKLNKTGLSKMTLKIGKQQRMFIPANETRNDVRGQIRDLQRQNSNLRTENEQLRRQRTEDLLLISRQNQVLVRLQKQINDLRGTYSKPKTCDCYLIEQHLQTIHNLQLKNRQLEEEKEEFKQQIRQLVLQQEKLKAQIYAYEIRNKSDNYSSNNQIDRWSQSILSRQKRKTPTNKQNFNKQKDFQREREKDRERARERERLRQVVKDTSSIYEKRQEEGRRYLQHLKNREIDLIANILQKEQ